jgi:hypothetical protein
LVFCVLCAKIMKCDCVRWLMRVNGLHRTAATCARELNALSSPASTTNERRGGYEGLKIAVVDDSAPSSRIALVALKQLGVHPDNILVFEDGACACVIDP